MDPVTKALLDYGVLGICVLALGAYILFLHRQASKEREGWKDIARDSTQATRENTGVVSALKTLLETTREKKR